MEGSFEVGVAVANCTRTIERGCHAILACRGPDGLPETNFEIAMQGRDTIIWEMKDGKMHAGSLPLTRNPKFPIRKSKSLAKKWLAKK